jgi:hypothetical protein
LLARAGGGVPQLNRNRARLQEVIHFRNAMLSVSLARDKVRRRRSKVAIGEEFNFFVRDEKLIPVCGLEIKKITTH